ncbi:MAG: Flp pilus assembly complex ATPase component TadA [Lentisphaerae bacterium]|nr:Flp pilus assembly complex ATPase component TadA [Lentisphaerota bacterium]
MIEVAIANGLIDAEQVAELHDEKERSGKTIRQLLLDGDFVMEDDLLAMMAAYQGCEVIDLSTVQIPQTVIKSVPANVARMHNVVPVTSTANSVTLATSTIIDPFIMDEVLFVLAKDVTYVMARESDIRSRITEYYSTDNITVSDMLDNLEGELSADISLSETGDDDEEGMEELAAAAPVIRFVNLVLYQAVTDRASDIHFEPFEKEFRIRYRVDGALYEMPPPPRRLALPIISRVKVMSGLNIAERRLPQDGRIALTVAGRHIDLRVSCLPTRFGESVVLRVLDQSVVSLDLDTLGLPDDVLDLLTLDIEKPNGIIIVTGPTGSGKTTTLYSCMRRINKISMKLLTAEEPVEYDIDGIVQVPINPITGNTFPMVLRAFLRQDPDILMIGEIRDLETVQIAIQASLTGHLVFSTLHTNDAAGAVTRLVDMGVEPYLVSSTLEAVLGQRLVRTICNNCKEAYDPDDETLRGLGLGRDEIGGRPFYYGRGCEVCSNTGYKGRKGIYEYLRIANELRELINDRKPTLFLREKARSLGMRTMREDGIRNVLDGYTTVDEVMRYT